MELVINTDGGARGNPGPAAIGVAYRAGDWQENFELYIGNQTNNYAEYMAVKCALEEWPRLKLSKDLDIDRVSFRLDSQLVVFQLQGKYKVKEPTLKRLHTEVSELLMQLGIPYQFGYVPRAQNASADRLVNHALDNYHA